VRAPRPRRRGRTSGACGGGADMLGRRVLLSYG
jgi:hypothetical protein